MLDLFTYSMDTISKQDQKIAKMTFASIYPHYVSKVEKKNRYIASMYKFPRNRFLALSERFENAKAFWPKL